MVDLPEPVGPVTSTRPLLNEAKSSKVSGKYNSLKVLNAFHECNVSESDFASTTGYGYNDKGRETIERVFKTIFKTESALVRSQMISGSHALSTCLFALLRPGDTLLSISGLPYDTLHEVIGI